MNNVREWQDARERLPEKERLSGVPGLKRRAE
jgi:hypothetical protein